MVQQARHHFGNVIEQVQASGTAMRSQVLAVDSRRDVREVAELESLCIDTYRNSVFVIPISTISEFGFRLLDVFQYKQLLSLSVLCLGRRAL